MRYFGSVYCLMHACDYLYNKFNIYSLYNESNSSVPGMQIKPDSQSKVNTLVYFLCMVL